MHKKHIAMLAETMNIFEKGHYTLDRETVPTKLSRERAKVCQVFLPEDIRQIENRQDLPRVHVMGRIGIECENMDSFEMARKLEDYRAKFMKADDRKVLVLNFANPTNPGGGVRVGASAQEEDLCRKSSLLLSLESKEARRYYEYNRSLYSRMGSDAICLTPEVEIIRDSSGALLRDSILVSVMTCAAPMVTQGKEGLSEEQYRALLYQRICRMLKCAASWGYRLLVLGAFGCGAFGNDAQLVSDLFYKALKEFSYGGMTAKDFFWKIGFAVLSRWEDPYNYRAFARNFDDFYRDEDRAEAEKALAKMRATEVHLDAIRGCLLGGAVGDALGYAVEFIDADKIFQRYGRQGIREYCLDRDTGKALISDDTQMTLFTATGLLVRQTRAHMRGICGYPRMYVARAYRDWLYTQEHRFSRATQEAEPRYSWLRDVPELYVPRAPGMTCLSALRAAADRNDPISFLSVPRNSSKGCGGVMRVAPLALDRTIDRRSLDQEAAEVAAITHGHSLGYMPAAVLCHVINRIVFPGPTAQSLKEIVLEARNALPEVFPGTRICRPSSISSMRLSPSPKTAAVTWIISGSWEKAGWQRKPWPSPSTAV